MTEPTALFVGDSITDTGRRTDPDGGLGNGYVRRIDERVNTPIRQLRVLNRGIDGNRVRDLAQRWDSDVIAERPDILTVLVGVNDTWRRYDSDDPTDAQAYEHTYDELVTRAIVAGIPRIVLMEPFVVPIDEMQGRWHEEDLGAKIDAVHAIGDRHGLPVLELNQPLNDLARRRGPLAVVHDGVHPASYGHNLIAETWLRWAGSFLPQAPAVDGGLSSHRPRS